MNDNHSKIIAFDLVKKTATPVDMAMMEKLLQNPQVIFWIHHNLEEDPHFEKNAQLLNLDHDFFDILNEDSAIPRSQDSESSLTIKIQTPVNLEPIKHKEDVFSTLIIHLTHRYCLTIASCPIPALQDFLLHYERSLRFAETPCFIMFLLIDNVLNDYAQIIFLLETDADDMDFNARSSNKNYYQKVMKVKKHVIKSKRFVSSIRDILMRISGRKIAVVSDPCRKSLYDLYNHAQIIVSETDSIREILNGLLDQIDNNLIFRMSETMKVLTAFAAIFLPLTLITGIYGMNFKSMPELEWQYGYYYAIGLIFISGISLFLYFRHKKWF